MKKKTRIILAVILTLLTSSVVIFNVEHTRSFLLKSLGGLHTKDKELLLTDIDYMRRVNTKLVKNFQNSDLVKRRTDLKLDEQSVDQYVIELFDSPSIAELFGIRTFPQVERLKPIYEGSILMNTDDAYRIERFKLEKYLSKEGQPVKDIIIYSGTKYREDVNYEYMQSRKGSPTLRTATPFEVNIEITYYNIGKEAIIQPPATE